MTTLTNLTAQNTYPVILTDTTNTSVWAALGFVDGTSFDTAGNIEHVTDGQSYVPLGSSDFLNVYRPIEAWTAQGRTYFVPASYTDSAGNTYAGAVAIAALRAMAKTHNALQYRDYRGIVRYVQIENLKEYPTEASGSIKVTFDLKTQRDPAATYLLAG